MPFYSFFHVLLLRQTFLISLSVFKQRLAFLTNFSVLIKRDIFESFEIF